MIKCRGIILAILLAAVSLVWAGATTAAHAAPKPAPDTASVLRDDSDCGNAFDVWTNSAGKTFIAYYGSSLNNIVTGAGTLHIYVGSTKIATWYVSEHNHYEAKSLGKRKGKWIYVELREGTAKTLRCSGYYQA